MTDQVERGYQARALIDNKLLGECLEKLTTEYTNAWRSAVTVEARENAHKFVTLIEKLKQDLQSIALTGELARKRDKDLTGESRRWNIL